MRTELVEIYSDASNAAVLRHPGRRYPGCLVQGDTLHSWVASLRALQRDSARLSPNTADELQHLESRMSELRAHYREVLMDHNIDLPFYEPPRPPRG